MARHKRSGRERRAAEVNQGRPPARPKLVTQSEPTLSLEELPDEGPLSAAFVYSVIKPASAQPEPEVTEPAGAAEPPPTMSGVAAGSRRARIVAAALGVAAATVILVGAVVYFTRPGPAPVAAEAPEPTVGAESFSKVGPRVDVVRGAEGAAEHGAVKGGAGGAERAVEAAPEVRSEGEPEVTTEKVRPAPTQRLMLSSLPPGADVYEGDEHLGRTPLSLERPKGERAQLRLVFAGRHPETRTFTFAHDDRALVRLKRERVKTGHGAARPAR